MPAHPDNARTHTGTAFAGACCSALTFGLLVIAIVLLATTDPPRHKLTVNGEEATAKQAALEFGGAVLDAIKPGEDADSEDEGVEIRWGPEEPSPARRIMRVMFWASIPFGALGSLLGGFAYFNGRRGWLTYIAIWPFLIVVGLVNALPC